MARALDKTQRNFFFFPPLKKIMIFRNALVTLGVGSKFKKILREHQSLLKNPLGGEVVQSEQACFLKACKDSDRLRDARLVFFFRFRQHLLWVCVSRLSLPQSWGALNWDTLKGLLTHHVIFLIRPLLLTYWERHFHIKINRGSDVAS